MEVLHEVKARPDTEAEAIIRGMYADRAEVERLLQVVERLEQEKQDVIFAKDDEASELRREIETLRQFRREDAAALEKMDERLRKENASNVQLVSLFDIFENEIKRVKGTVHAADLMKMGQLPERRPAGSELSPQEAIDAFHGLGEKLGVDTHAMLQAHTSQDPMPWLAKLAGLVRGKPRPGGYVEELSKQTEQPAEQPEAPARPPMMESIAEDLANSSEAQPAPVDEAPKEPAEPKA
jgi:hypothetical protein